MSKMPGPLSRSRPSVTGDSQFASVPVGHTVS